MADSICHDYDCLQIFGKGKGTVFNIYMSLIFSCYSLVLLRLSGFSAFLWACLLFMVLVSCCKTGLYMIVLAGYGRESWNCSVITIDMME